MTDFDRFAAGRVIRRERKKRQLSQEVFSGLAGLARSHLSMIENGEKQANFETIWRIACAFNMAPHKFVRLIEQEIRENQEI